MGLDRRMQFGQTQYLADTDGGNPDLRSDVTGAQVRVVVELLTPLERGGQDVALFIEREFHATRPGFKAALV